ncbi:MAG: protein translocase subunit SecF [Candidatus Paceibacterota bacterium]
MFIINNKKIFLTVAAFIAACALGAVAFFGLNFGIEFTGGSMLQVSYDEENVPSFNEVQEIVRSVDPERSFVVQETGEEGYIIRTETLDEDERVELLQALSFNGFEANEERFSSIGPSIGAELANKALVAIILVVTAIILFIAYVFRRVSQPVSSWRYGITAIVALFFDIIVPVGLFAVLGHLFGAEIDVLFVTALLAILGFSVNDTIVVFDRIRENLRINKEFRIDKSFSRTVGESLEQTFVRSINTSLTTLFVLVTLFFVGPEVTQWFALVLMTGVVAGTYSSLFLASPILVLLEERQRKKEDLQ